MLVKKILNIKYGTQIAPHQYLKLLYFGANFFTLKDHSGHNISHHMANNKLPSSNQLDKNSLEISEFLTKRYRGISVYGAVMILLAVGIIWTAVLTAEQVQQYHEDYMALQKMKVEHRNLQIENQRLVIEQQTFSATPQIASRAVTQLGMYSPSTKDKLILQPTASKPGDRLNIQQPSVADEAELSVGQQGGENE